MEFESLLRLAKQGDVSAKEELYQMYRPGLIKKAMRCGQFDEDLFQDLCTKFLICIDKFEIDQIKRNLDEKETDMGLLMN